MNLDNFDFVECHQYIKDNYVQGSREFVLDNYCNSKNIVLESNDYDKVLSIVFGILKSD